MATDPVVIVSAGNESEKPSNPVRIVNWSEFIAAVVQQIQETDIDQLNFNTGVTPPDFSLGRVYWDAVDSTLAIMQGNGGSDIVIQQVGQEQNIYARNDTASDIPNGSAVYLTGSLAYRPTIGLAKADSILPSRVVGITTQQIDKNTQGFVTTFGLVRGIDTQTPGWNEGDKLYLSATVDGELTTTPPASGFSIRIGLVVRKHVSDGVIFVNPERSPFFGNYLTGDYTQFYYSGLMRAFGGATCFRDELQSLVSSAAIVTPANDIVTNAAECTKTFKASARYPTDYLATTWQLNHDWALGTNVFPHLHIEQTNAQTPNFLFGIRWQKQLQEKTTAWTLSPVTGVAQPWGAYTTLNQILTFAAIAPPVGYGQVSDIIDIHLWRDYTNASGLFAGSETTGLNVEVKNADAHIEIDMLGSDQQYIKYPV